MALVLAACTPPPGAPEYRDVFPLKVKKRTFAVTLKFAADQTALIRYELTRVDRFAAEYRRRAISPMLVATSPGDQELIHRLRAEALRDDLVKRGLRAENIVIEAGTAPVGSENIIVLMFRGYDVDVPECGDWSGEAGYNPTNLPNMNYGCAFQRNLGLMIANPRDLLWTGALGPMDSRAIDRVLGLYRAGESTETALPKAEQGTIADIE